MYGIAGILVCVALVVTGHLALAVLVGLLGVGIVLPVLVGSLRH